MKRRGTWWCITWAAPAVALYLLVAQPPLLASVERPSIRVGMLHSLSRTKPIDEPPVVDATERATMELNFKGWRLGGTPRMSA